jgi:hypothetical protein
MLRLSFVEDGCEYQASELATVGRNGWCSLDGNLSFFTASDLDLARQGPSLVLIVHCVDSDPNNSSTLPLPVLLRHPSHPPARPGLLKLEGGSSPKGSSLLS